MFKRTIDKSEECQNCHQKLEGENYCPNCGQFNNVRKPVLSELIFELVSNLFAFDSKFYRSIGPLLFNPGKLTVEYTQGKRQKYMLPLRLFLVATIILLAISSTNNKTKSPEPNSVQFNTTEQINDSLKVNGYSDFTLDFSSGDKLEQMTRLIYAQDSLSVEEGLRYLKMKPNFFNKIKYQQVSKLKKLEFDSYGNYIRSKLLFILLLFIPFLALLLKIIYLNKSEYYFIDHYIFSLHEQTVLFIILIISSVINIFWPTAWLFIIALIVFALHLFKAMRVFYKETKWLTLLKYFLVNMGFFFVAIIFVVLSSIVTFLLY